MTLSHIDESTFGIQDSIEELEQHLLALGPLPRQGELHWNATQWANYAGVVRRLAQRLTWSDLGLEADGPEA